MHSWSCGQPTFAWQSCIASSMTSRMMPYRSAWRHAWRRKWSWYVGCAMIAMETKVATPLRLCPVLTSSIPSESTALTIMVTLSFCVPWCLGWFFVTCCSFMPLWCLAFQVCEGPDGIQWPQEEKTHLPRLPQIAQFPPNAYLLRWIKVGLQRWPSALLPPLPPLPLLRWPASLILNHPVPIITKGGSLLLAILLHVIPARVEVGCLWLWPQCVGRDSQNMSQEGSEIELTRFLQHSSDNQHGIETLCEDAWSNNVATTITTTTWVVLLTQGSMRE